MSHVTEGEMEFDYKKSARRQYLRYFRLWFLVIGILIILCFAVRYLRPVNHEAPEERVYDYAEVLTDQEEEKLRQYIAQKEKELRIHIVLVTFSLSVEGEEAREQYGFRYTEWERNMEILADDFWDLNYYGYNKGFEGDGVILIHNWYPGQNGEHLSTSGKAERRLDSYDIDSILYAVDAYYETDPYKAYQAYIDKTCELLEGRTWAIPLGVVFFLPFLVACIYAVGNIPQKKAAKTTSVNTYVEGGKPELRDKSDEFIRKSVTSRRIETSSSSGGGGRSSGGGGHHYSSSGASHGGGSHRH